MIEFDFEEYCCGCGACATVCLVDAIAMKFDKNGFPFPAVDSNKCINCKQCDRVCPHLNNILEQPVQQEQKDYSAWLFASKDNDAKMRSSSGAAFFDMACAVIADGGAVCGCAWDENLLNAKHIVVDTFDNLTLLQGSKYLQSIIDVNVYKEIEKRLKHGQTVLFSGTPCQCEAAYRYMSITARKYMQRFLLIAVICHGVSAPAVWRTYKEWMEKKEGEPLLSVNFRDKSREGYKKSYCKFQFKGHTTFLPTYLPSSPYMESTIVYNLALRKSCSHCECKGIRKTIDILIGDWYAANTGEGIWGTSCVVPCTEIGMKACKKYLRNLRSISMSEIIKANPMIVRSSEINPLRDTFLKNNSVEVWDHVERYYPAKYKIKKVVIKMGIYQMLKDILSKF